MAHFQQNWLPLSPVFSTPRCWLWHSSDQKMRQFNLLTQQKADIKPGMGTTCRWPKEGKKIVHVSVQKTTVPFWCKPIYLWLIDWFIHIVDSHPMEWKWRICLLQQQQWLVTATKHKEPIAEDAKAATALFATNNMLLSVIPCSDYIGVSH